MNTSCILSSLLLLAALTSACGSSDSGPEDGPIDPGGPLLDRPAGAKYDCAVSRPMTRLSGPWGNFSLLPGDGEADAALVVAEHSGPTIGTTYNDVTWSTLGLDGQLGAKSVVSAPGAPVSPWHVSAASDGDTSTLVWGAAGLGGVYSLNSAQVDASGTVLTPASVLATSQQSAEVKIAKLDSGYALLTVENSPAGAKLSFGLLDEAGLLASPPVVIAQGSFMMAGSIASVGSHFAVSYSDNQYYESGKVSRVLFLDGDGSVLGEPFAFEDTKTFAAPSLLARGNEVLAAWSVTSGNTWYEVQEAATTIRLARFGADGKLQGKMYDLQAPVEDREAVEPLWVEMGDDVGLLWAEGEIIYICGGCVPDHSQKFVVLDGQSLIPQGKVVELANSFPSGGLLSAQAARKGDELLVVSTLTYHTWGEGASGALRCVE